MTIEMSGQHLRYSIERDTGKKKSSVEHGLIQLTPAEQAEFINYMTRFREVIDRDDESGPAK